MAEQKHIEVVNVACNVKAAYDFESGNPANIGHILKFSFPNSGEELEADIEVLDPMTTKPLHVVAIVESAVWDGGRSDTLHLVGRVSAKNRANLKTALVDAAEVKLKYNIKCYDHDAEEYYEHFHTHDEELAFVVTEGSRVFIDPEADTKIQQPRNHRFNIYLTAKSKGKQQEVAVAESSTKKRNYLIGVATT